MGLLEQLKAVLEYAGGMIDTPPFPWMRNPFFWGIWWGILILLIVAFSGQSSKFIYIDF